MGLHIAEVRAGTAAAVQGGAECGALSGEGGGAVTELVRAVVVDARAGDDGVDGVPVPAGGGERLEDDDAGPAGADGACGVRAKGPAVAVRREDVLRPVGVAVGQVGVDEDTADEHHVGVSLPEQPGGDMHADERTGAGRLHGERGSLSGRDGRRPWWRESPSRGGARAGRCRAGLSGRPHAACSGSRCSPRRRPAARRGRPTGLRYRRGRAPRRSSSGAAAAAGP